MERYTPKSSSDYLKAGALAVTLLLGCGGKEDKIAPDPVVQHSLDMKVANAETVNGGLELDLSTKEKTASYFFKAAATKDENALAEVMGNSRLHEIPRLLKELQGYNSHSVVGETEDGLLIDVKVEGETVPVYVKFKEVKPKKYALMELGPRS